MGLRLLCSALIVLSSACGRGDGASGGTELLDLDADGDPETTDCDDRDGDIHHDAVEILYDGIDQVCDGLQDDDDRDGDGALCFWDGAGCSLDCDDQDASVYPGAMELCDGADQDCDGVADDGAEAVELDEVCGNGIDDDCDGEVDGCAREGEIGAEDADAWFLGSTAGSFALGGLGPPGDVTGDGVGDVVVQDGVLDADGVTWTTLVYVYAGPVSGSLNDQAAAAVLSDRESYYDGSASGDLDGDGLADLAFGRMYGSGSASIDVFAGPVAGTLAFGDADVSLVSDEPDTLTSIMSLDVGDLNVDETLDLLGSVTWQDASYACASGDRIVVHYGPLSVASASLTDADVTLEGDSDHCFSVATFAGDLDGDGAQDIAVGASSAALYFGATYVLRGPVADTQLDAADVVLWGDELAGYLGEDVESAGDMDEDGRDDLWVMSYARSSNGDESGDAQLVRGSRVGVETGAAVVVSGREAGGATGLAAGDLNGDARPDVALASGTLPGAVGVFYGPLEGASTLDDADLLIRGEEDGCLGYVYLFTGDASGDGLTDLLASDYCRDGYASGAYLFTMSGW